ncbi:MAG: hypothetical protein R2827_09075 [Bdellovibrionales bacterium]
MRTTPHSKDTTDGSGTFAPVEKPEITVFVLAEHACAGSSGGAPVAKDVIQAYMEKYHPDWVKTKNKAQTKSDSSTVISRQQSNTTEDSTAEEQM